MAKRGHREPFGERQDKRSPLVKKRSRIEKSNQAYSRSSVDFEDGDSQEHDERPGTRRSARGFIASQACANCRLKKTKCDEGQPCTLCSSLGIECQYSARKVTRKEASLSTVMSALRRVESKLDQMTSDPITSQHHRTMSSITVREYVDPTHQTTSLKTTSVKLASDLPMDHMLDFEELVEPELRIRSPISFSQHKVLFWPAISEHLPASVISIIHGPRPEYAVELEMDRPSLSVDANPYPYTAGESWLRNMPFSIITGLSEAYFNMFNPDSPILDSDAYFETILGPVIRNGFGFNSESCLVLNVLALGCLALKTYEEGDFPIAQWIDMPISSTFQAPDWIDVIREHHPGLRFFNESRKRAGAFMCENSLLSTQFYLLSGYYPHQDAKETPLISPSLYYSHLIRPTDQWAMTNKACTCLLTLMRRNPEISCDDWASDMLCRLFWTALMAESILIQELDLPPSGLQQLEAHVPIPKFTPFLHTRRSSIDTEDNTFFQFHFLAQVAHRIILTRIRNTIFFYSKAEPFPPAALVSELHHQIEQWQASLPDPIKYSILSPVPYAKSPAHAFATAMLRARYYIANFHIGRPFIYKALHNPSTLTEADLEACRQGLAHGMDWDQVTGVQRMMVSGMPIKFGLCSQFFGQLLMIWAIENSSDARVRKVLPEGYKSWCGKMISFLEDCSHLCLTIDRDLEVLRGLGY